MHRHRVEARFVVAGDHVEIPEAQPVFGRRIRRDQIDHGRRLGNQFAAERADAAGQQPVGIEYRLDAGFDQRRNRAAVDQDALHHRFARLPAVVLQIGGDAADGVDRAVDQVDAAVVVEIDRITAPAAGQELRVAKRAGVGAAIARHVAVLVARQQEQLAQFAPEQFRARRIVERQRGQGADDREVAGVATVDRFDADDGGDHMRRHAVLLFGARQRRGMFGHESASFADAQRFHEAAAVALPGAHARFRRRADQFDHPGLRLHRFELRQQPAFVEAVRAGQFCAEGAHIIAAGKAGGARGLRRQMAGGKQCGAAKDEIAA